MQTHVNAYSQTFTAISILCRQIKDTLAILKILRMVCKLIITTHTHTHTPCSRQQTSIKTNLKVNWTCNDTGSNEIVPKSIVGEGAGWNTTVSN